MIRFVGIDPLDHKILVVKSTIHYRAAFEPIASEIIEVDARGCPLPTSSASIQADPAGRSSRSIRTRPTPEEAPAWRSQVSAQPTSRSSTSRASSRAWRPSRRAFRPKLEAIGRDLLPEVARIAGGAAFAHVARHARRTVNPPDDTWVAFALDKRGYKKHCHFKVAVSRGAVRFLFEAGPEHAGKKRWPRRGSARDPSSRPC